MKIKNKVKSRFFGRYLISEFHVVESWLLPRLISDKKAVKKYHRRVTGEELDLTCPKTFAEKTNWYKLNSSDPLMVQCADKVAAREYVASCGFEDILNESYCVYDNVSQIDINKLPSQFVLKAAHGSHMNIIVKDKDSVNWRQEKMMMSSWLRQNIYWSGREWVYKDVSHRIIAERYLEDEYGELRDYKFFCYHGEPTYLQYDGGRFSGTQKRGYYDMEMNRIDIFDGRVKLPVAELDVSLEVYKEMQKIAEKLSEPFPFVRVDLYEVNGKIYFGEMTFFDGGGSTIFTPEEWNTKFSEKWICA